jgi:hypothetical protein
MTHRSRLQLLQAPPKNSNSDRLLRLLWRRGMVASLRARLVTPVLRLRVHAACRHWHARCIWLHAPLATRTPGTA